MNKTEKNDDIKKSSSQEKSKKNKKCKIYSKKNLLLFFFPLILSINLYFIFYNPIISELEKRILELELKLDNLDKKAVKKKISIAFVFEHLYLSGIARLLVVLTELLAKTEKYDVYLINPQKTDYDFDEEKDIDIYILNNEFCDIYHSLGKKVIEIFHGVFLSNIFQDTVDNYKSWEPISKYDSYIHIIPDDYYAYKKLGFNNTIFIPNIYTFDSSITPSSKLKYKNILMVGRVDDDIKGAIYGIKAMGEIVKEIPDAKLYIIGMSLPQNLMELVKELNIEKNVITPGFSMNIT